MITPARANKRLVPKGGKIRRFSLDFTDIPRGFFMPSRSIFNFAVFPYFFEWVVSPSPSQILC